MHWCLALILLFGSWKLLLQGILSTKTPRPMISIQSYLCTQMVLFAVETIIVGVREVLFGIEKSMVEEDNAGTYLQRHEPNSWYKCNYTLSLFYVDVSLSCQFTVKIKHGIDSLLGLMVI